MLDSEIINKLMSMPAYEGVIDLNGEVIPLWQVGVDKVKLKTFLESAKEHHKRRNQFAFLHIPFSLSDDITSIERKVKDIESNYPVQCFMRYNSSVEDIIYQHWYHQTCK